MGLDKIKEVLPCGPDVKRTLTNQIAKTRAAQEVRTVTPYLVYSSSG